jgi:hypothetical protein
MLNDTCSVAIAGDALHLMPPFIGQGLNSGFRDAAAIAWRLPLILSGLGEPTPLLRSFQVERLQHLEKITRHCILLGEAICETDPKKSAELHRVLRANRMSFNPSSVEPLGLQRNCPSYLAPPKGFDPPLGKPGLLTDQEESGRLSLHRQLKIGEDDSSWYDQIYGYGWRLVTMSPVPLESLLNDEARHLFIDRLSGKCINIKPEEDITGEYSEWFEKDLGQDHVVLIRPDFYNFGHAHVSEVNTLVGQLRSKMRSL